LTYRGVAALALAIATIVGCLPQAAPEPQPTRTAIGIARPRFELATYMYALQTRNKIRIGVLDSAAPFSSREPSGRYVGFEPDLGRALANSIFGLQPNIDSFIEWVSVDPSTAATALTSQQADVVFARLAATPDRAAVIDVSDPYFIAGERILVQASNGEIDDLDDLDTKTVCVQSGSGVDDHVDEANGAARTLALDTYSSCLGALQRGQVDAIGASEPTLWDLIRQDPSTKIVGRPLVAERYGVGTKKHAADRQGFLPFLNQFVADVVRGNTWARLYVQHITPLSKETKTSP
jgi:ABC-type amino acid transport substrate-binding protein